MGPGTPVCTPKPGLALSLAECGSFPWPERLAPSRAIPQAHEQGQCWGTACPPVSSAGPVQAVPWPPAGMPACRLSPVLHCAAFRRAGPAPGFIPKVRPTAPQEAESVSAERRGTAAASSLTGTFRGVSRRRSGRRHGRRWRAEVQASTPGGRRELCVAGKTPSRPLGLPYQVQKLPAKRGPYRRAHGLRARGSVYPGDCPGQGAE